MDAGLPDGFDALERFVPEWIFGTERERNAFRVAQPLESLREFYDALLPRLDAIVSTLDTAQLDRLSRPEANLLELALMAMEVAPAIEYYGDPDVPNSVAPEAFEILPVEPKYRVIDGPTSV